MNPNLWRYKKKKVQYSSLEIVDVIKLDIDKSIE